MGNSKYDNQKYTGMAQLKDGKTYDTYRDSNKAERYDDPKNTRTLIPFSDTEKTMPPAVLAKDRAEKNRPKNMDKYAKDGKVKRFDMGGYTEGGKVGKVMGEFKSGSLKSSSGQKVTNRKQAMAIAMSEAGKSMKTKKYAAGGKTDKRSFSSGDVFSNYDVGEDPFLKSRKGGTFTDKEMKDGLTKEEIMRKTTPKAPKAKYAAGGNVKRMADGGMSGRPQYMSPMPKTPTPIYDPKAAAAKAAAVKKISDAAAAKAAADARARSVTPGRPDMGILPGYKGPAPTTSAPTTYKYVNGKAVPVGMKRGGKVGESKKMVNNELKFMRSKGAPKSMIKHEMGEAKGMKRGGGKVMKFANGGSIDGCAVRGKTKLPRGGK